MTANSAQAPQSQPPGVGQQIRSVLLSQEGVLFLILVIATAFMATQNPNFFTVSNLLNQGRLMTEIGLLALPMTFIIVTGGIDLSVGSVVGLAAIMLGYAWEVWGLPLPLAIVVALMIGALAGFMNGAFIVYMKVPPLIMTLATLALYRGLAEGISRGRSVRNYPEWFYTLGQERLLGVPAQLWLLIIAVIVLGVILARTTFGRSLYAIGNNEIGARFSGLKVNRYLLTIYTLSGFMSAIAGWIFVSRVTTTRSDMGNGWELDAIAAVVLGGTSIFGGTGSITGTVIGLILIQLLKNGLSLMGITGDATIVVIGSILILSILINNFIQGRNAAH